MKYSYIHSFQVARPVEFDYVIYNKPREASGDQVFAFTVNGAPVSWSRLF